MRHLRKRRVCSPRNQFERLGSHRLQIRARMSDFSFMRSGVAGDVVPDDGGTDFMRKVVSILAVLSEEAVSTAERFVKACGRTVVTSEDMLYALRYESRAFWDKDIADRFFERLREERQHTYDSEEEDGEEDEEEDDGDDEEDDEEDEDEEDEDEEEDEEDDDEEDGDYENKFALKALAEADFHNNVMSSTAGWQEWQPDDPVKRLLKQAIDNTAKKFA